ncbi:DUF5011 domain-containing protein [Domibacillus sp. PGB-M46]|uniref:DUF5011 domain-containing protein n=1 Tax=Domibacillus sp. PGB-M46 TaxID=2910255 RepID=UPI001F582746|nr:DUF5011 domain-containing protein [Domibacillus sp. PGB-M46]MCI2253886.1 DUF5011 domain-containing protein [Domibacillus sp. PGB-M46]
MKRKISIVFLFLLSFSLVYQMAFADAFPGIVTGSTVGSTGTGTVTVTNAPPGSTLKLYTESGMLRKSQLNAGAATVFNDTLPGRYYVTSTTLNEEGEAVVSDPSSIVNVSPAAVVITSERGSSQIKVTGGVPGATFTLYNETLIGFVPRKLTADVSGQQTFTDVPVGKNYRVTQTVNGAESAFSVDLVDILPNKLTAIAESDSGTSNNLGSLRVNGGMLGYTVELYKTTDRETPFKTFDFSTSTSYVFTGLPAGKYVAVQVKNGLMSLDSNEVTIKDEQAPVVTLTGASQMRIIYPASYIEPGVTAADNDGMPVQVTSDANEVIPSPSIPGVYKITYTARDTVGNESTAERVVTIAPNVVTLSPVHTSPNIPADSTGEITVNQVIPGAFLYLYKDTGDSAEDNLIQTITNTNAETYEIINVPVGEQYYVIQEFNGVKSDPSKRIDVLDKTPPVLSLNGDASITLTAGEKYTEYGASPTDNIDKSDQLNVVTSGSVDIQKPGIYTITYHVTDAAGNKAKPITRTITVKPGAVTAIGSSADIGEIGVKGAMPGTVGILTTLSLYQLNDEEDKWNKVDEAQLMPGETTHVFKPFGPGKYYVTQTINGQVSIESNIVDVIDTDRPVITLIGPEKLFFSWNESKDLYYNGETHVFSDPGASAVDYLDGDLSQKVTASISPDAPSCGKLCVTIPHPGTYTLTYNVMASRGAAADEKKRVLTIAPPKPQKLSSYTGESTLTVSGLYEHETAVVTLYNAYDQKMDSKAVKQAGSATFSDVPAGLGYYVTQKINGIESAPSNPANVSLHPEADPTKFIGFSAFSFPSIQAVGVIDHKEGTIHVTVPAKTNVTKMKASFSGIQGNEQITVKEEAQISGTSVQDFSKPLIYKVYSHDGSSAKMYTVTVKIEEMPAEPEKPVVLWPDALKKKIDLTTNKQAFTVAPSERNAAIEHGVSFESSNNVFLHVPPAVVTESTAPILTARNMSQMDATVDSDPVWKNDLSQLIQIQWQGSLVQPIEVQLPNPSGHAFVRLVREDGKLYAIEQPSEKTEKTFVGLVSQPGTYALLPAITPPKWIESGTDRYMMNNAPSGTSLFYTDKSLHVSFERSARVRDAASYVFDAQPSVLSSWQSYVNGKEIEGADLYAVAVRDQIISRPQPVPMISAFEWAVDEYPLVPVSKMWAIQFSYPVDRKLLFNDVIYITENGAGKRVPATLHISLDGKMVNVAPKEPYKPGVLYTLWIDKQIEGGSKSKHFLSKPVKLTFMTK